MNEEQFEKLLNKGIIKQLVEGEEIDNEKYFYTINEIKNIEPKGK